jgi:hypothetical protein
VGRVGSLVFLRAVGKTLIVTFSLSEQSQNGEDQMETDLPPNTNPDDLSKYKLDEYDKEPDKKGPSFDRLGSLAGG